MNTYAVLSLMLVSFTSLTRAQWVIQHSGLPASVNPTLIFSPVNKDVCWGIQYEYDSARCALTTDGGSSWRLSEVQGASGLQCRSISAMNADTAWVSMDDPSGTTSSGIFKTTDGGANWVIQGSAFSGAGGHPRSIHFFDRNSGLCVGNPRNGYWEIYTTTNGGAYWSRVPSSNIPAPVTGDESGGGVHPGAGSSFWFGTLWRSIYRTTDRGMTWSAARNIPAAGGVGVDIAFKDSLNGLACSYFGEMSNRLSRTTDGGGTWTQIVAPSIPSAYFITYVPGTIGSYMITSHNNIGYPEPTISGSAYTVNSGIEWAQVDDQAHGGASFANAGVGWSGGPGDVVYKWVGTSLHVSEIGVEFPNRFALQQNYPNPFNPSTRIQFQVPGSAFVSLKVYDVLGREVRTLVNEELKAGSYEATFDASGLASGVYFYRLQAAEFTNTKKLLLVH